ncbi:MAG: vitamin B12 dependent-methionine synthase activation domain-containing protein [Planctomycetota bacterium]|jgi:hypothetical protein
MEARIIDRIPFELDNQALLKRLHLTEQSEYAVAANRLAADARAVARPKAMYKEAYVEEKGDDFVVTDGIKFTSRVLRVNLDKVHRVFPYVATCGRELMQWADRISDPLENYWADEIMLMALGCARAAAQTAIISDFAPGKTAAMNPGSLEDWPLQEQVNLMELLGDPYAAIGLELTASCLMVPVKSISGIAFPTEFGWENCQLCQRENCPGRRAPYDRELHEKKYGGKAEA